MRAADQPAEPDQPRAREDVAEQVVGGLVPVLDDPVEPARRSGRRPAPRTPSRRPSRPACRAPSGGCRSARPPRGRRARSRARRSAASAARSRSPAARTAEASRAVGSGPMHDLLLALLALLVAGGRPASHHGDDARGPGFAARGRSGGRGSRRRAAGVRAACSWWAIRWPWGRRRTWPRRCRGGGSRSWPGTSKPTAEGVAEVTQRSGSLPEVIAVSLGTNDDPSALDTFEGQVLTVLDAAGRGVRRLGQHRAPAVRRGQLRRIQPGAGPPRGVPGRTCGSSIRAGIVRGRPVPARGRRRARDHRRAMRPAGAPSPRP